MSFYYYYFILQIYECYGLFIWGSKQEGYNIQAIMK